MELVLSGLNWKICLIYLDNVIVYGGNPMVRWTDLKPSGSASERQT